MDTYVKVPTDEFKSDGGQQNQTLNWTEVNSDHCPRAEGDGRKDMYGIELVYIPEKFKKKLDKLDQICTKHFDSLTTDQIEECIRKAVVGFAPRLTKKAVDACVAREMDLVREKDFASYLGPQNRLYKQLLLNMPLPPLFLSPDASSDADANPDHPASE